MKTVEKILAEMEARALESRHAYIVPEHLLLSMAESEEFRTLMPDCRWSWVASELEEFLSDNIPCGADPIHTPELRLLLEGSGSVKPAGKPNSGKNSRKANSVRKSIQKPSPKGGNTGDPSGLNPLDLLERFYSLEDSQARYILETSGIFQEEIRRIRGGVIESDSGSSPTKAPFAEGFLLSLNRLAKEGRFDTLVGRKPELGKLVQTLSRRRKNNPILVGDPGVGKTAVVEGLSMKIVSGDIPPVLSDCEIFSLEMGGLLAGTNYRGEFEKRLKSVIDFLKERPKSILFIDEIHSVLGAGACEGSQLDACNMLKPALARGEIRCIGATSYEDYKRILSRDRAFARRLHRIDVREPSESECVEIIKGLLPEYERHHGVKYDPMAVEAAVSLSAKYINGSFLPDKAIDVIDEAGAKCRLFPSSCEKRVSEADIELIVGGMAKIPPRTVRGDEMAILMNLSSEIRRSLFGQDEAVEKVVKAIKISRAGFGNPVKPVASMLFCGKTGVGKTELARQLARSLGVGFISFDMSEYSTKETVSKLIGTSPGYVGFEQAGMLTDAIIKEPHCVLLLDEIEKADPGIYNILLQVMDSGTLTENCGRKADFRNVILIMTSNAGAFESGKSSIGFNRDEQTDRDSAIGGALKRCFSPEFRNRLDGIVFFNDLGVEMIEKVVRKLIAQTNDALSAKSVSIVPDESAIRWIAAEAMEEKLGARPVERIIVREIKEKIVDEILFGKLKDGGELAVTEKNGKLNISPKELTGKSQK